MWVGVSASSSNQPVWSVKATVLVKHANQTKPQTMWTTIALLALAALAATASAWEPTAEDIAKATASKFGPDGRHFMADCEGFDCLQQYVNHDDGMFHWEDLNYSISGKSLNPLSDATWTGERSGWWW